MSDRVKVKRIMSRSTRGNKRLRLIASFDGDVACRKNAAVDGGKNTQILVFHSVTRSFLEGAARKRNMEQRDRAVHEKRRGIGWVDGRPVTGEGVRRRGETN